jgi:NAD(P)-dependent dehydrogenase (short-subunit alcohol dehydrogenase family)
MLAQLLAEPRVSRVYAFARRIPDAVKQQASTHSDRLSLHSIDLSQEASIAACAEQLKAATPNLVLVTTGLLHAEDSLPEKSWRNLEADYFQKQMQINALAPALLAKHLIPLLPKDQRAVFAALSARVGSIGDNRLGGWYSYRASKAALNMLLRCTAIEAKRRWPKLVVAGLHPGTVDTPLSQPFQARVPEGKLFTPEFSTRSLLQVIDGLTPADSGNVYAWDGQLIQP